MKYLLSSFPLTAWPQISLVLFVAFFVGLIVWTYRPGAKGKYQAMGKLPLDDELKDTYQGE